MVILFPLNRDVSQILQSNQKETSSLRVLIEKRLHRNKLKNGMPVATEQHTPGTLEEHCIRSVFLSRTSVSPLFSEHRTFVGFLSLCCSIDSGEKVSVTDDNV